MSSRPRSRRPTVWSTASLRLAAAISLILALGGAVLMIGLDYGLIRSAEAEIREDLVHQMAVMQADAERLGGQRLIGMLESQARNREARRYLFLVETRNGRSFSNGLARIAVNEQGFRVNLPSKARPARWPDQRPNMLILSRRTSDGTLLAIGRDIQHLDILRRGVHGFALWTGLAIIALALAVGLGAGLVLLRRLEGVNRAVERIIAGRSGERLPAIGLGREFDGLGANLNRMIERQEAAMSALKSVSEAVAHDLRTPLARLRNRLEEARTGADPATAIDDGLEEIDRLSGLFDALLDLARTEGRAGQADRKPFDAAELAAATAEIYRPVIEEAGGTLRIATRGPLPGRGDAPLLQQALANLLENAVAHGGEGPNITVGAERRGERLALYVADRGPGVPADEREKVLGRFYRMDRSRSAPGSGLGLTMCAAVARAHGGEIVLADNAPGLRAELLIPAE
ncbi:ATP-binding protein [Phenylobacterium sp.]|jgi:signal transduction histidine kinase|uniref:sensor histidine kinase n=1 Tax=Phenylobacterium sp. TaxID=1871053 RepID=UPI003784AAD5